MEELAIETQAERLKQSLKEMTEERNYFEKLFNTYIDKNKKLTKALEEIVSMTSNPREYQPSYYSINHIALNSIKGEKENR